LPAQTHGLLSQTQLLIIRTSGERCQIGGLHRLLPVMGLPSVTTARILSAIPPYGSGTHAVTGQPLQVDILTLSI